MKLAMISITFLALYIGNSLSSPGQGFDTWFPSPVAVQAQPAAIASEFHRGYTDLQKQPCRPDWDRSIHYESEIISKKELVHIMGQLGIPGDRHDTMAAIIHAESGSQLNCSGDDYAPYYMVRSPNGDTWTRSYGLAQIRLLKGETGSGSCRDFERLDNNPTEQISCMWEISGEGNTWSPWTVTHAKRGYPYKKWLGQDW